MEAEVWVLRSRQGGGITALQVLPHRTGIATGGHYAATMQRSGSVVESMHDTGSSRSVCDGLSIPYEVQCVHQVLQGSLPCWLLGSRCVL